MKEGRIIWLLFSLFFISLTFAKQKISLKNCRFDKSMEQLTVQLSFSERAVYHAMLLKNPDRLVVDCKETELTQKYVPPENDFLKSLRVSDHDNQFLRLVFDLKQKINYTARYMDEQNILTLTLSVAKKKEALPLLDVKLAEPVKQVAKAPPPSKKIMNMRKKIVVVIDPGHGGKDPGAIGPSGMMEKIVVLKIAKQLQKMLSEEPNFHAILTRATDRYLPLRKRLLIARKKRADMFIAIHADAYHHSHATGASVYALSERGATSEAARWLAEKENESELGGLSLELADKDAILRSVLIDLSQTHTIESSLTIGNTVLENLGKFSTLHHLKVEQAAFVVLKSPDIPSILVETGFLSNPQEEEKLIDPAYQKQTAFAIKEGIKHYFLTHTPSPEDKK